MGSRCSRDTHETQGGYLPRGSRPGLLPGGQAPCLVARPGQQKCPRSRPHPVLTLAMGMSLLLLLVLSSPVLGFTGRLAAVRRPGLEGPVACMLCRRV